MADRPRMDEVEAQFAKVPHVLRAPWTPEEVKNLNDFQDARPMHPFTCGNDHNHGDEVTLVSREDGWHCPECDYTQDWAWPWMATDEWKKLWTFAQELEGDE